MGRRRKWLGGGDVSLECRQAWQDSEKDRSPRRPLPVVQTRVLRTRRSQGRPRPGWGSTDLLDVTPLRLASLSLPLHRQRAGGHGRVCELRRLAGCLLLPRATTGLGPTPPLPAVHPPGTFRGPAHVCWVLQAPPQCPMTAPLLPRAHTSTHTRAPEHTCANARGARSSTNTGLRTRTGTCVSHTCAQAHTHIYACSVRTCMCTRVCW